MIRRRDHPDILARDAEVRRLRDEEHLTFAAIGRRLGISEYQAWTGYRGGHVIRSPTGEPWERPNPSTSSALARLRAEHRERWEREHGAHDKADDYDREKDSIDSYHKAIRAIGEDVKAGGPPPKRGGYF